MLIEGAFPVAAQPQALLCHLFDARLVASCLPGCEALERIDDDRYRAVVVVAMAGIKARFDLQVEITKREERHVWAVTRGEEGGRASTLQADSRVSLEPTADGTVVNYRSEVSVSGRLGRFALGMMKKKAQSMGDEFAANLRQKLEAVGAGGDTPDATAAREPARGNVEPPLGAPAATSPAAAGQAPAGTFQPAADRPVAADGSSAPAPVDGDASAGAESAPGAATPSSPAASPAQH
jgi:carbon monoxide dehydrogenase subunit G